MLSRIIGIPIIVGIGYEIGIKWAGGTPSGLSARILLWPGIQLQRLTTREPSFDQLQVAAAALEEVMRMDQAESRRSEGSAGPHMIERLAQEIEEKYAALTEQMADPEVYSDQSRYAEISKAHSDLEEAHRLAADYLQTRASLAEAEAMLDEGGLDPEMKEFLLEEKNAAREKLETLEQELRLAVLEKDPRDEKNAIVEVRAGAGGDEAALFAAELQRMIMRYAERQRFKTEHPLHDRGRLWAGSKRSSSRSRARAPSARSSTSRACTGCSACR